MAIVIWVLFHFANAAMLPLVGEMLSAGKAKTAPLFMMGCVVVTQAVITALAWPSGRFAEKLGRKPILLVGFASLPVRGVLFAFVHNTYALLAIQILDGIGASLSQFIAGSIVHHFSYRVGFLFLSVIAVGAFVLLLVRVPETCNWAERKETGESGGSHLAGGTGVPPVWNTIRGRTRTFSDFLQFSAFRSVAMKHGGKLRHLFLCNRSARAGRPCHGKLLCRNTWKENL